MATPHSGHVSLKHSVLMLLAVLTANASPNLHLQRSDSCPSNSQQCTGTGLPDNFCCSSSSTCIIIDSGSSVICCPDGQDCTYIEPITCDVAKQNASLYPSNVIKTTRLDDDLPTCGDSCCPFGYTCQGDFCAMDDSPSSTSTQSKTTETTTTSASTSTPDTTSTETPESSTTTTIDEATSESTSATAGDISTISSDATPTIVTIPSPTLSQYSASSDSTNLDTAETKCPAFPTNAVLAGFFPGTVFGAVAALLLIVCIRRHQRHNLPAGEKVAQNTFRKSTGTLIGISDPIPSDESSFRTDFLLRANPKRNSEGTRSVLQRSRSRVKSLFSGGPKPNTTTTPAENIPPVPAMPMTPPRQRQPSTESIRVYTPPGVFASSGVLNPAPYPDHRPNTTLTEILDQAQAQMQAQSAANSASNSQTNSIATTATNQRFLQPPGQSPARRKQLPY
ncbi:hypothetical protein BJY01DRAFT_181982 [Aspergillus pseudoustus]|uniref:GPI transamidase component PIG-S n=1 Tax=Aspergillus pseudoustus TaxID=1810923 RepID=A0ABR4JZD1_9EURO